MTLGVIHDPVRIIERRDGESQEVKATPSKPILQNTSEKGGQPTRMGSELCNRTQGEPTHPSDTDLSSDIWTPE